MISSTSRNAVMFCDYPDSDLRLENVDAAIRAARAERGRNIPNLPEYNLIGCFPNQHPDHQKVRDQIRGTAYGMRRYVSLTTNLGESGYRTDTVPRDVHDHAFATNPSSTNIGAFQRAFGWLTDGYWSVGTYRPTQWHWQGAP